ncbi:hypothetical protein PSPTOT1_0813 [Pseudomonas syringae pv. tomato T1]|nr:hypothetical protein PSPTOT1_0813 [Pseudomonas syringae pv. tomato T1]
MRITEDGASRHLTADSLWWGSNGAKNQRKAWVAFASPVRWWGIANFDLLFEFITPLFGGIFPSVVLANPIS